jgi:nucleoid-associated protein Lsr2
MAKKVITLLTDDLDGGEADRTIDFGLDGVAYTIDLSEKNVGKLRKALDPYLAAGTRMRRNGSDVPSAVRTTAKKAPVADVRAENKSIRQWANSNGYGVAERGRIPIGVVEAYQKRR